MFDKSTEVKYSQEIKSLIFFLKWNIGMFKLKLTLSKSSRLLQCVTFIDKSGNTMHWTDVKVF